MPIPKELGRLSVPVIAAPMFLASGPDLVVACGRSGIVGTFPALNQRTTEGFAAWLDEVEERLEGAPARYGVNLIVHGSNPRLKPDLEEVVRHRVPLVITSLGAVADVVAAVHSYGGLVFHDVTTLRHAEKAVEAGVDGIIAVAAGAGGHAGTLSPFALIPEIREMFDGTIVLAGAIGHGAQVAAARLMGADLAYLGSRFLATQEAAVSAPQKAMMAGARSADIVYTPNVSGIPANFLRASMSAAGLDPEAAPEPKRLSLEDEARAWRDVWSAGQGVGAITDIPEAATLCARLVAEYRTAMAAAAEDAFRD